jgi:hypothetical protein
MPARMSSSLILGGFVLVILVLWYLAYRVVKWDTRRRGLRPIEQKVWVAAAIALPLLGFAVYLFVQVLHRYLSPQPGDAFDRAGITDVYARSASAQQEAPFPVTGQAGAQPASDVLRQEPMPGPAWGDTFPAHSNGKAHGYKAPETVRAAAQPLTAHYALTVVQGPLLGQQFILDAFPARIGRGPEAEVALDADLNVSRSHAEIYEWNGMLRIRDLGSMHGVRVNDVLANDQALSPGDRIGLGGTVLVLRELP